jgi:predicted RNA binding protein YcfA (HicA-like mRNA interferase family)
MTQKDKLISKIKNAKTVDFEDIDLLLNNLGFKRRSRGTSHHTYTKGFNVIVIVKHGKEVKRVYLDDVKTLLETLGL